MYALVAMLREMIRRREAWQMRSHSFPAGKGAALLFFTSTGNPVATTGGLQRNEDYYVLTMRFRFRLLVFFPCFQSMSRCSCSPLPTLHPISIPQMHGLDSRVSMSAPFLRTTTFENEEAIQLFCRQRRLCGRCGRRGGRGGDEFPSTCVPGSLGGVQPLESGVALVVG